MNTWSKIAFSLAAMVRAFDHDELHLLQQMIVSEKASEDDFTHVGYSAPLSEAGYQSVASLKSNRETEVFIERVASAEARAITDAGALSGLAPYYSGTVGVQTLEDLKKELRAAPWVGEGEGRRAPLNEDGYQAVTRVNNEAHMVAFARRILDSHGMKSSDEGKLKGFLSWFDGRQAVQSFEKLQSELLAATWVEPRIKTEVSFPRIEHEVSFAEPNRSTEVHVSKENPERLDARLATTWDQWEESVMQEGRGGEGGDDEEEKSKQDEEQQESKQDDEEMEKREDEESKQDEEQQKSKQDDEEMEKREGEYESRQEDENKGMKNENTRAEKSEEPKRKETFFSWLKRRLQ